MLHATPFSRLVEVLRPGATGRDLVELLDGKANRTTALHWRSGRRGVPQWAIEILRDKLRRRHERERLIADHIATLPERPGLRAGAKNLAAYLARR